MMSNSSDRSTGFTVIELVIVAWVLAVISAIAVPTLMLVAGQDMIIPPAHAERLYERWPGPKRWIEFPEADHESISAEPGYWRAITTFLDELT